MKTVLSPQFSGVRIEIEPRSGRKITKIKFDIDPDSLTKGVQYQDKTNPSPTADELIVHEDSGRNWQINIGDNDTKELHLKFLQIVDDSPMPPRLKTRVKRLMNKYRQAVETRHNRLKTRVKSLDMQAKVQTDKDKAKRLREVCEKAWLQEVKYDPHKHPTADLLRPIGKRFVYISEWPF